MKSGNLLREVLRVVLRHVALDVVHVVTGLIEGGDAVALAAAAAELAPHALRAHGDADLRRADHDALGDAVQGLHAAAALPRHIEGANGLRQAGQPGHVVAPEAAELRDAAHVAQADLLDLHGVELRVALQERLQHLDADLVQAGCGEAAASTLRERRPHAVDQYYVLQIHSRSPLFARRLLGPRPRPSIPTQRVRAPLQAFAHEVRVTGVTPASPSPATNDRAFPWWCSTLADTYPVSPADGRARPG